jgi:rhamnopyranosyl-N-acetylglucosaminyl-diphospho-decaprenol beta-1,3/1,4-galactofuranosyltransferase
MTESVYAVLVTHRRLDELAKSLDVLTAQTHPPDHVVVVDNDDEERVRDLVAGQPVPTTYLGSRRNLGGAGGFALGMLHALALGADWVWCADDDGRPQDPSVLATLLACARRHGLAAVSPMVCDVDDPARLAFPLRRGIVWRRHTSELRTSAEQDLLPGIASLFNGALFRAATLEAVGVPDLRLFVRGDETEIHRRLVRSGLSFGTCLDAVYLHPRGSDEFKPILGGRMHAQYPDNPVKRFYTYRNRGYLLSQPGLRRLLPQEWLRFGWFFLMSRRDPAGLREWVRLQRLGRRETFGQSTPEGRSAATRESTPEGRSAATRESTPEGRSAATRESTPEGRSAATRGSTPEREDRT